MSLFQKGFSFIRKHIKSWEGRRIIRRYLFTRLGYAYLWLVLSQKSPTLLKPICKVMYRFFIRAKVNIAKEGLFRFKEAMDAAKIDYWLEYGTLLGAYRTGKFIEEDFILRRFDLDTGVFLSDNSLEKIEKVLTAAGFKKCLEYTIVGMDRPVEQSYLYKGIKLDVFCFFIDEERQNMYSHYFAGETVYRQTFPLAKGFTELKLYDKTFPIPDNVEAHLSYYYGPDYMKPAVEWSVFDCSAFTKTNQKGSCKQFK